MLSARAGEVLVACMVKGFGEYIHDVKLLTIDQ
jgi:hypothetical protein